MNVKQLIVFFSISAIFFMFILIYNVYGQCIKTNDMSGISYEKSKSNTDSKPIYTSRPKPAGAPTIIKNEAEAELLLAKISVKNEF